MSTRSPFWRDPFVAERGRGMKHTITMMNRTMIELLRKPGGRG